MSGSKWRWLRWLAIYSVVQSPVRPTYKPSISLILIWFSFSNFIWKMSTFVFVVFLKFLFLIILTWNRQWAALFPFTKVAEIWMLFLSFVLVWILSEYESFSIPNFFFCVLNFMLFSIDRWNFNNVFLCMSVLFQTFEERKKQKIKWKNEWNLYYYGGFLTFDLVHLFCCFSILFRVILRKKNHWKTRSHFSNEVKAELFFSSSIS